MTYYRGRRESGHYPPGAEFDPNAPWNQIDYPYTVTVEKDTDDELHPEDQNVAGVYKIEAADEDAALDEFHATVPIKVLEHFAIWVEPDE